MPKLFKRGNVWWCWINGERRSTGCRDRKAAELAARELERRAADPAYAAANTTSLDAAIRTFLDHTSAKGRSPRTYAFYEQKAGHITRVLKGHTALAAVTPSVVDGYIKQRLTEGASRHTVKKELVTLTGVLRLAKRRGEFVRDIDAVMPSGFSSAYEPRKRFLRPDELERLLAELHPMRGAHVAFIVATSARRGEAERAERADVNLETGHVVIRGTKTAKSARIVPVPPAFRPLLERALRDAPDDAPLFRPWDNMVRDLCAASKRAKVPVVSANDLRRTTAQWLRQAGVDAASVAEVLGHADARMVERVYGKQSPADLGRALERVPALAANTVLNLYGAPSKTDDSVEPVDSANPDNPPEIWRAPPDSNGRPADSKSDALSS